MRIIFMGTPRFAVPAFRAILAAGHDVVACYTRPPRPAGRGRDHRPSPVHLAAMEAGTKLFTPVSLRDVDEQDRFSSHGADVAIVVAYGLLLPPEILNAPAFGCLNLHGSKLPRWRGAAPIQRAIMAGDTSSAVQVMRMDEGLDTGDIALSLPIDIPADMTAGQLHDRMMVAGAGLVVRALEKLEEGELDFTPQPSHGVTYAKKISKSETRIDWSLPGEQLHNIIRGLSPFPGSWTMFKTRGRQVRVKILQARPLDVTGRAGSILELDDSNRLVVCCGRGGLEILRLQRAGGAPMGAGEFIRGAGDLSGQILAGP